MKNEEAIEILNEERNYSQFPCYVTRAIEIATSAVKKQIPKKPIKHEFLDDYGEKDYYYVCPNRCDTYCQVYTNDKFCHKCGQALDWSDTK